MKTIARCLAWLKGVPKDRWLGVVPLLFCVLLAQQAAQLTWRLLLPPSPVTTSWRPTPLAVTNGQSNNGPELQEILNIPLFGRYQAPIQSPSRLATITAPKTRLSLTLSGLVTSSEPTASMAIIAKGNQQESYFIGNHIADTRVRLHQILADRVILDNEGTLEALYLDKEPAASRVVQPRSSEPPHKKPLNDELEQQGTELLANPTRLTELVNISPAQRDGGLVGYRITPGKSPELFNSVGLEPNDLAVSINGYDLTDNDQAMLMLAELPGLTEVSMMVERNGQLQQIFITLQEE